MRSSLVPGVGNVDGQHGLRSAVDAGPHVGRGAGRAGLVLSAAQPPSSEACSKPASTSPTWRGAAPSTSAVFGFAAMVGDERICAFDAAPGSVLILVQARAATTKPIASRAAVSSRRMTERRAALRLRHRRPPTYDVWKHISQPRRIAVESEVAWPTGGRSLYFRDPDGLLIELATSGCGELCALRNLRKKKRNSPASPRLA